MTHRPARLRSGSAASSAGPARIGLATEAVLPDLDDDDVPLATALLDRGVEVVPVVWNGKNTDWSSLDAVVIRSTWDYSEQLDGFLAWTEEVSAATPLFNDAATIRWNTHKGYLLDLREAGIPTVPTEVVGHGERRSVKEVAGARGWDRVVVKLAVSAGGRNVHQLDIGAGGEDVFDELLDVGDVLVQPFLADVTAAGELSVVLVDGAVTHAVRKHSQAGDFRINVERGVTPESAPATAVDLAVRAVAAVGDDVPLYARVDLLREGGNLVVAELELVEPNLFFRSAPRAADVMAEALLHRLQGIA